MSDWPPFKSNSTPEVKRGQKVATGLNILDSLGLGVHCTVYSVICTLYKTYLEYLVIYSMYLKVWTKNHIVLNLKVKDNV